MINKPVAVLTVSGFALAHNKVCILRILSNKESFYCWLKTVNVEIIYRIHTEKEAAISNHKETQRIFYKH